MLDLGCGKGGDLQKWQIARIAHYVGADLSRESIKEASSRHNQSIIKNKNKRNEAFPAIFIVADASDRVNSIDKILKTHDSLFRCDGVGRKTPMIR